MLSVRGEFGYWVFEGDLQPTQRPSWNYRAEDGGGIILDMLCHWRYVLDHVFGAVESLTCLGATHITKRWDEDGKPYEATAEDAAYATFMLEDGVVAQINSSWQTRVYRDDLVDVPGRRHARLGGRRAAELQDPAAHGDAAAGLEPRREAHRRFSRRLAGGARHASPIRTAFAGSGRCSSATSSPDAPWHHTLLEGAKGVQLAELALESWKTRALGRRAAALAGGERDAPRKAAMPSEPVTLRKPQARRAAAADSRPRPRDVSPRARRARSRPSRAARSTASPSPPRTSSPIRSPSTIPWLARRDRLGRDDRLSPPSLGARLLGRRGDGYGAARHGARLAERARADPPLGRRREGRRAPHARERRRHRPSRPGGGEQRRRRDPRLRGAVRGGRGGGLADHPDGEPRARARGALGRRLSQGLRPPALARRASR